MMYKVIALKHSYKYKPKNQMPAIMLTIYTSILQWRISHKPIRKDNLPDPQIMLNYN